MIGRTGSARRRSDLGYTLAEVLVVVLVVGLLAALAVPRFLNEQNRAYLSVARSDARSLSVAVSYALADIKNFGAGGASIQLTGTGSNQQLVVTSSAAGVPSITVPVRLTPGALLEPGGSNNSATSQANYCVAVNYQGRVAYQNGQGAVTSCETNATVIAPGNASNPTGVGFFATPPTFIAASGLDAGPWLESAYGTAGWVTVSPSTNKAAVSSNGSTWTPNTSMPSSAAWSSVAFGAGTYVALGSAAASTAYATSTNGTSWTSRTTLPSAIWTNVTFGGSQFVAVGTNAVATSRDGITWTSRTIAAGNWSRVAFGGGVYVAIQSGSTNVAAYSSDGITWTTAALPSTQAWSDVAFGGSQFVIVANSATAAAAVSSTGAAWTATANLPISQSYGAVAYSNGVWIAVASGTATAYSSTDGLTWVAQAMSTSGTWTGLTPINGVWVLTSNSTTALIGI